MKRKSKSMLVRSTLLRKRACKLTLHALLRPVLRQERGIPADDVFLRLAYYVQGVPNSKSNARGSWSEKYIWRNIFVNYQSLIIQTCPDLCSINQKKKTNKLEIRGTTIHPSILQRTFLNPSLPYETIHHA